MSHLLAMAIVLQLHNLAAAPADVVRGAECELARVYDEIGVQVSWDPEAERRAGEPRAIQVILVARESGDLRFTPDQVIGATVWTAIGSPVVYVFYQRVQAEAERYGVSVAHALGCALAHELGHVLMPDRGHSADGLMRASWGRNDFQRADRGQLKYSGEQAARIRAALDALVEHERRESARE